MFEISILAASLRGDLFILRFESWKRELEPCHKGLIELLMVVLGGARENGHHSEKAIRKKPSQRFFHMINTILFCLLPWLIPFQAA